jgi:outer membrane receptor protein involved in Fe transport
MNGRTLDPNRVMRRLPPVMGGLSLRGFFRKGIWMQAAVQAAARQTRLNAADFDDERMGASRRRADIATFFASAVAAPYITGSIFQPTGENLRQIQDRVLPLGTMINGVSIANDQSRVPMLARTAGWTTVNLSFGIPLGERLAVRGGVGNALDSNYRVHGSGVDGAGRNVFAGLRYAF